MPRKKIKPKKRRKPKHRTDLKVILPRVKGPSIKRSSIKIPPIRIGGPSSDMNFMRELNRRRKTEYEKWRIKKRMLEEIKGKRTLIIGIRARDGVVLASDRKVIRGGESEFENKIRVFNITPEGSPIIFAAAGYLGVTEDFLELFQESLEENVSQGAISSILSVKFLAEDILKEFEERYGPRLEEYPIQFVFGGLEQVSRGKARLYMIGPRGYGEKIKFYQLTGHGSPYARTLTKFLLDRKKLSSLTVEEVSERAYACIRWIADGVDDYVGGDPQIIVLKDDVPHADNVEVDGKRCEEFVREMEKMLRNLCIEKRDT